MSTLAGSKLFAWSFRHGVVVLLLGGCVGYSTTPGAGVAVEDRSSSAPTTESASTPLPSSDVASLPGITTSGKADVTLALIDKSATALRSGNTQQAVTYIERAIRINPRRADLWIQLARLQLHLGEAEVAEGYAQKAITLAGSRLDWVRDAWLVIADAKQAQGKANEANVIRERWRTAKG